MEPEDSLSWSQEPSISLYPEPDLSSPYHPSYLCTIHLVNPVPSPVKRFVNRLSFYGEELLAPCLISKLEAHLLSTVRNLLFNIFVATYHVWKLSPPPATRGRPMPCWQETHLTRCDHTVHNINSIMRSNIILEWSQSITRLQEANARTFRLVTPPPLVRS